MDEAITARIMQLAVRGAAELPNDPFNAFEQVQLAHPKKMNRAARRASVAADLAFAEHLAGLYETKDSS